MLRTKPGANALRLIPKSSVDNELGLYVFAEVFDRQSIKLRGVRVHNLKNVDVDIPHGQLLVVCGVSGSGKSSFALDTLYAEGQRRYVESLSPHARQFLDQFEKPDADLIDGIPPAIAVRATRGTFGGRSTVGTATEIADYLRLLFVKIGQVHCPICETPIVRAEPETILRELQQREAGRRFQVAFAETISDREAAAWETQMDRLRASGFARVVVAGKSVETRQAAEVANLARSAPEIWVIVDRLTIGQAKPERIRDSLETAFAWGNGRALLLLAATEQGDLTQTIDGSHWLVARYSGSMSCPNCDTPVPPLEPRLLSFNSALGACAACEGFGNLMHVDMEMVVPDVGKSIRDGAIAPWRTPAYAHELEELLALAPDYGIPVDVPFRDLTEPQVALIRTGVPDRQFGGLDGFFDWLRRHKYKVGVRVFLNRWRRQLRCPDCGGTRLTRQALAVRIADRNIAELCQLQIRQFRQWLIDLELDQWQHTIAKKLVGDVVDRAEYLCDVGLGYLTLDRPMRSLSGGETQRVSLTSCLGSTLVNMLYVLDEPSVGLHAHDMVPLTRAVRAVNSRKNTVVVVEHEEMVIRSAERVIEFGPEAGEEGGNVVFDGSVNELLAEGASLTGDFIMKRRGVLADAVQRRPARGTLRLTGATGHNLQSLDVEFPLGCMVVVSGVSGAGKSTLVKRTLHGALCQRKKIPCDPPLPFDDLYGDSQIDEVIVIDQSPIGRSSRSNPVTYVKAFDEIRRAFADTTHAKTRNFGPNHFSFNVDGGRCTKCKGAGDIVIDMQFLSDIVLPCDQCKGTRFRAEILDVQYRGKNIDQLLRMTVREAFQFFRGKPKVQKKLKVLIDVGLGYIALGQPASSLSTGEGQRLKLAAYLHASTRKRALFLMDEPTSGLHMRDIVRLVDCFDALLAVGHSLIVVEHNLQLMKYADWIIDLGPGAADDGGRIVAHGTPEQIAACPESITGRYLEEAF
jgi:excinuclease ABC subunit A